MVISVRPAQRDDLESVVELIVDAQPDPERFCSHLADDATAIAGDIADVVGPDGNDWTTAMWVAIDDEGSLMGSLLAETDPDMRRVWWWGPTIADSSLLSVREQDETIDRLFAAALARLRDYDEHEMAIDSRATMLAAAARRHGLAAAAASVLLRTQPFESAPSEADQTVVPIEQRHHASVIEWHDELFPGTHTPGDKLVHAQAGQTRLVIEADDDPADPSGRRIVGYVATELQNDGSLYIDYLGVATGQRGQGLGRRLVSEAMRRGAAAGASHAHLTVRVENANARRLYAALGFIDERVVVPYRRGFSLD